MKLATLVVLAFTLLLQGCIFTNPVLGTADLTDVRTLKVSKGDVSYEISGDIELIDYTQIYFLIDKLPKD